MTIAETSYQLGTIYVVLTRAAFTFPGKVENPTSRQRFHSPQVLPTPQDLNEALNRLKIRPQSETRAYAARFIGRDAKLRTDMFEPVQRLRLTELDKQELPSRGAPGYNAVMRFLEGTGEL